MSEQASGQHGPIEDEAIKRQDLAEVQEHGEEWPDPEDDDDNADPDGVWAPEARLAEDWEAIELRSDLARHLDRTAFPATRGRLLDVLQEHQADQRLLDMVSGLSEDARFNSAPELFRALRLPIEERPD